MQDKTEGFLKLFLAQRVALRGFISSILRGGEDVDDILQEVVLVLWQKFDSYDRDRPFGAWARGIAYNKVLQARGKSSKKMVLLSPEAVDALSVAYDGIHAEEPERLRVALRFCMKRVSAGSRKLLKMRYEMGLKLSEMGRRLDRSLAAVNMSLGRIRTGLHECIDRHMNAAEGPE